MTTATLSAEQTRQYIHRSYADISLVFYELKVVYFMNVGTKVDK